VGPGGHSTLERHCHVHLVWISRGRGRAYIGGRIHDVAEGDVLSVPSLTWHQFGAPPDSSLGFHCLVAVDRDKPLLPNEAEWQQLTLDPSAALFLRR
jgi:quercetin dioxygenase-like cupin family protein